MTGILAPGSELAGYRLEAVLGRGGMGVVWLAHEGRLERRVALKLLAPELAADEAFRERFLREMRLAAALEHPHVLPVYAAGEADGQLFLALRLVEGEDLAALLRREGPLAPERALPLLRQLAGALDAAHAAGLLHRDVKPANVLLAGDHAYLTDFGLARDASAGGATRLAGTYAYLAPELVEGRAPAPAADRYAFACLAFECLSGQPPFVREVEAALLYAHLREPPPPLPEPLAAADPVLARALAKDPDERHASCRDLVDELARAFAGDAPPRPAPAAAPARADAGADARLRLPAPPTPLVGRTRELEELARLLADPAVRLLTLTGPGGTGKTRLALALAERLAPRLAGGAALVALAPVSEPQLVLPTIAVALGVKEQGSADVREALARELADAEVLLVLDNFEQLLDAAPEVAALLDAAPRLRLLVTSRAPLRLRAEHEFAVPPLRDEEAADLFLARASALVPSFAAAAETVAAIARRLDCLPLALELAAARVRILSADSLLERLEQALAVLTGGARDLPERQRTLRAAIEWSVSLLEEPERDLLGRLSVFAGGFGLDAAERVADADLDRLAALVEHSLLRSQDAGGEPRFSLLHVIREYARELPPAEQAEQASARHAALYVELAERWEADLRGPGQAETVQRFDVDADNFRAALARGRDRGEVELELRLAGALGRYWYLRGLLGEGRGWLEDALERSAGVEPRRRLKALNAAGSLARVAGDTARADELATQALEVARACGDLTSAAKSLTTLAGSAALAGDLDRARQLCEESVDLFRELGDRHGVAVTLANSGELALARGDEAAAEPLLRESVALARELADRYALPLALCNLGLAALARGAAEEGEPLLRESLERHRAIEYEEGAVSAVAALGIAAVLAGEAERGAELLGAAQAWREALGFSVGFAEAPLAARALELARERLGEDAVEAALERGRAFAPDAAVELALEAPVSR